MSRTDNQTNSIRTTPVHLDISDAAQAKGEPLNEKEAVHVAAASVVGGSDVSRRDARRPEVAERVEQEVMSKVSPDGRSPDLQSKQAGRSVFVVAALVALGIGAAVVMYMAGGWLALAAGAGYVLVLFVAGMPVWGAGLLRRREEEEVKTEVVDQLRLQRRRNS